MSYSLAPGVTCSHLGPRAGSKTKKTSTKRWESKGTPALSSLTVSITHKGMNPLAWHDEVTSSPPESPSQNMRLSQTPHADDVTTPEPELASTSTPLSLPPEACHRGQDDVPSQSTYTYPSQTSFVHAPLPLLPLPPNPGFLSHGDTHFAESLQLAPDQCSDPIQSFLIAKTHPTATSESTSPSLSSNTRGQAAPSPLFELPAEIRWLNLKDRQLQISESQVPDPPVFNAQLRGPIDKVVENILTWWDDQLPQWDASRALLKVKIDGEVVGIPGVLWKELYAPPWKPKQWKGLKHRYSELKCLMHYYQRLSPDDRNSRFWNWFSVSENGVHRYLPYSRAAAVLRHKRQQMIQEQATEICTTDPEFLQNFSYRQSGKVITLRNATAIVKRASRSSTGHQSLYTA
ncbi:hypothetical protein R3P38DRAFT_3226538 [Favolaschia claudopus]|uniref:Uncharacterized protein n=1 Tax=Favolaschia claudopus TaxID=2862362 RepID=A0AAV9ZTC6_9AGAR